MRKTCALLSLLVFFTIILSLSIFANDRALNLEYADKIILIKKVQQFEKRFGLKETVNFKEISEKSSKNNIFCYSKKTDIPFSYIDPKINLVQSEYDTLEANIAHYKIDTSKYNVFLYIAEGVSGGSVITMKLLGNSDSQIAEVVFHEDFHDNVNLPRHIDESAASVVGELGSREFFSAASEPVPLYSPLSAILINTFFEDLLISREEFLKGEINDQEYADERCIFYGVTELAFRHTYTIYQPLICSLYQAMGRDLKKLIVYLKNFPIKEPRLFPGLNEQEEADAYFRETLYREKLAEMVIQKQIERLTNKKR